jgi:hypothetical protein
MNKIPSKEIVLKDGRSDLPNVYKLDNEDIINITNMIEFGHLSHDELMEYIRNNNAEEN